MKLSLQSIRTPAGEELVVLPRADFDALLAIAQEAEEDADDVAIFDERMAALSDGRDAPLPPEISAALLAGATRLRAIRKWKGLTQVEIAERTGLAQGYISDLDSGRKAGTGETMMAVAKALGVDPAWLAQE